MTLIIRNEQMEVLGCHMTRRFEDRMLDYLRERYAALGRPFDPDHALEIVRLGMERATLYGMTTEGEVAAYIEIMVLHGIDFDKDPAFPGARIVLADRTEDPPFRVEHLWAAVSGAVVADDVPASLTPIMHDAAEQR